MKVPPKSRRVAFYVFGIRALKPEDREWLKDDIESGHYFARFRMMALAFAPILAVIGWFVFKDLSYAGLGLLAMGVMAHQMTGADPAPAASRLLRRCDKRWARH